jgi:hypothetical protein
MHSLPLRVSAWSVAAWLGSTSACVPAGQYREAQATVRAERTAHQKVQAERDALADKLRQVEAVLASARAMARERDSAVEAGQQRIAQTELDVSVVSKQREDAAQLVDQLRSELARSSDHLRAFSDQKRRLEQALAAAEARLKELGELQQRMLNQALVVRDLALALYQTAAGKSQLVVVDGPPILRVPVAQLFAGRTLKPAAKPILGAIARAATLHPEVKVEVTLRDTPEAQRIARLKRITDALTAGGLPAAQIVLGVPPPPAPSKPVRGVPAANPPLLEFRLLS